MARMMMCDRCLHHWNPQDTVREGFGDAEHCAVTLSIPQNDGWANGHEIAMTLDLCQRCAREIAYVIKADTPGAKRAEG